MAIFRILNNSYIDKEFINEYDAITFSFCLNEIKEVIKSNKLSNVIRKEIIELRSKYKNNSYVRVGNYNNDTYAIWDIHLSNINYKFISIIKIINLCKLNNFNRLLIYIHDLKDIDILTSIYQFIVKEYNINIDIVYI